MKSYIKAIIIFNKNGEKRVGPLEQGVNIITGESKTGKSALVESLYRDRHLRFIEHGSRLVLSLSLDKDLSRHNHSLGFFS